MRAPDSLDNLTERKSFGTITALFGIWEDIMRNILFIVSLSLLPTIACAPPAEPPAAEIDIDSERTALMDADKAWNEGFSSSDTPVDAFLDRVLDDARFQFADAPPTYGIDQIRPVIEQMVGAPGFSLKWAPTAAEVSSSADLGYTVGAYELSMEVEGKPMIVKGHYVTIWKKQEDGSWKVAVDAGGPSEPPAPSEE
jgi:ketosteroid isomerase-like protein